MLMHMRTTVTIADEVLEQLKKRAASEGTTVSRLIEDAVRLAARPRLEPLEAAFELVTFGQGGRFTSLDVDHISELIEQDDVARYGRRG
jgi:hypothetical protein